MSDFNSQLCYIIKYSLANKCLGQWINNFFTDEDIDDNHKESMYAICGYFIQDVSIKKDLDMSINYFCLPYQSKCFENHIILSSIDGKITHPISPYHKMSLFLKSINSTETKLSYRIQRLNLDGYPLFVNTASYIIKYEITKLSYHVDGSVNIINDGKNYYHIRGKTYYYKSQIMIHPNDKLIGNIMSLESETNTCPFYVLIIKITSISTIYPESNYNIYNHVRRKMSNNKI